MNFRKLYVRAVSAIGGIHVGFSWKFNKYRPVESFRGILIYGMSIHAGTRAHTRPT